jgi:hypothetical protein
MKTRKGGSMHSSRYLQVCSRLTAVMIFLLLVSFPILAKGQGVQRSDLRIPTSDQVQILTLQDGSTLKGRIIEIGPTEIKYQTDVGVMTIDIDKIKEVREVPAGSAGEEKGWFENPNTTRLYFGPTGRTLKKGDGYFSDIYLFLPGVAYGLTDNITIGAGMSIVPGVDFKDQVFFFTPKIGVATTAKSSFAISAIMFALPEVDDESPFVGVLFGTGTFGSSDASISGGVGYGFVDDEFADKPAVMIGGEKRFARRLSFVSENWIFPGVDQPLVSYGLRFFGEGLSVDLALFNALGDDAIFPGIPYVDFVFNF